jgi:hypothetical protein
MCDKYETYYMRAQQNKKGLLAIALSLTIVIRAYFANGIDMKLVTLIYRRDRRRRW